MASDYTHRQPIVWQRAQQLALTVMDITRRVPQSWANAVIVRQVVGSATSVGANIAEGHGRFALGAHRNHLSIARGSAAETDGWLDLMRRSGWITAAEEAELHAECMQIMAMLTSKMRQLDQMAKERPRLRERPDVYAVEPPADELYPFDPDDYLAEPEP